MTRNCHVYSLITPAFVNRFPKFKRIHTDEIQVYSVMEISRTLTGKHRTLIQVCCSIELEQHRTQERMTAKCKSSRLTLFTENNSAQGQKFEDNLVQGKQTIYCECYSKRSLQ